MDEEAILSVIGCGGGEKEVTIRMSLQKGTGLASSEGKGMLS